MYANDAINILDIHLEELTYVYEIFHIKYETCELKYQRVLTYLNRYDNSLSYECLLC